MSPPTAIAFALAGGAVAFVATIALGMWLTRRWIGTLTEFAVSSAVLLYLIYNWSSLLSYCNADPIFLAPTPEEEAAGSIGGVLYNCDSAGGVLDYLYLGFVGPLVIFAVVTMTTRSFLRLRRQARPGFQK